MVVVNSFKSNFSDLTISKSIFYVVVMIYFGAATIICFSEPFLHSYLPCEYDTQRTSAKVYSNPSYIDMNERCMWKPYYPQLLGLSKIQCDFGRRQLTSVLFGIIIGWERRRGDRAAGIRTMSLISLGACLFTICSAFTWMSGPQSWDAARVSAAIPSGVGFLGAAQIFKGTEKNAKTGEKMPHIHGLNTASAVWVSAAVGISCGGKLYFVAMFTTSVMLLILRFGPRLAPDLYGLDDPALKQHVMRGGSVSQLPTHVLKGSLKGSGRRSHFY